MAPFVVGHNGVPAKDTDIPMMMEEQDNLSTLPLAEETTRMAHEEHKMREEKTTNNNPQPTESFIPIAIVGMAMRLPGDVRTAQGFWEHVMGKKDGCCSVPPSRYSSDKFYHPTRPEGIKTTHGYFLHDDPACFDAAFFSLTAHEAARKDIGCYVGTFGEDWLDLCLKDPQHVDRYHALGTGAFALSNHLSYKYDLRGPSVTIQMACSSSLMAVHEACQSLAANTCSAAIVAGSNLILSPTMTATMSDNMVLSPSGICRTFDTDADGYGRGEAVNALYLKRLGDALRDGDPMRAVIRSTAANCDGKSSSLSAPSSDSQDALIRTAYRRAGIHDITETGFFECHGTDTIAGDVAEATALARVLEGKGALIGAVKPNFGHSEGASGITSTIKAVLSLEHNTIPPNAFFETPNPLISFKENNLVVPTQPMNWPKGRRQRVSVNGFGIGGSNTHIILESCSEFGIDKFTSNDGQASAKENVHPRSQILVVSDQDKASLDTRISQIVEYVKTHPNQLQNLSYTLGLRRKHLTHRAFANGNSHTSLEISDFHTYSVKSPADLHFVLTGQGAQWTGMRKALIDKYPSVKGDIHLLDHALMAIDDPPSWSLEETLRELDGSRVNNPEFGQPLCTAIQICLINLLASWGIKPASVIGHSSGEIAAASAAGAITAPSAIIIAYYRGKLANSHMGSGDMASMGLGRDDVAPYLVDGVVIACENSPRSVTISGAKNKIDRIVDQIRDELPDTFCRKLRLNIAYHSPHMATLGSQYEDLIASHIQFNNSTQTMIPMFSSVTTKRIISPFELNSSYWRRNLESPVRFHEAVVELLGKCDDVNHIFIEVGPHSSLSGPLKQIFQSCKLKNTPEYISTLIRNDPDCESQLLSLAGVLHIKGAPIDFLAVNGAGRVLPDIPPYPWRHTTQYWKESRLARDWRLHGGPYHELLGFRCPESTDLEPSWRNLLRLENVPWLSQHVLQDEIIFPGTGYIAMAGEAIQQLSSAKQGYTLRNVMFKAPLILQDFHSVEIITSLKPVMLNDLTASDWYSFTIMTYDENDWTHTCSGQVRTGGEDEDENPPLEGIRVYSRPVSSEKWYRALSNLGLSYGPQFQGLEDISADPCGGRAAGIAVGYEDSSDSRYAIHPTVIDQCLQLMSVAGAAGKTRRMIRRGIPASLERLFVGEGGNCISVQVDVMSESSSSLRGNATALFEGQVVISLHGMLFFSLDHDQRNHTGRRIPLVAQVEWKPDIDIQHPQDLLPTGRGAEAMTKAAAKGSILYILETADKIRDVNSEVPHLMKWKHWVVDQAAKVRDGKQLVLPESKDWASWSSEQRLRLLRELISQSQSEDAAVVNICGEIIYEHCVDIMNGTSSALGLLMDEGRLEGFYRTGQKFCNWDRFLTLLCHSNPLLRILEIGAGTGSATADALRILHSSGTPMYAKYTFTDISPGFFVPAKEKFREYKKVDYQVLDISHPPNEQGFNSHEYDLVIASNALHATPNLKKSLQNVHELLAPNGRLLLHELRPDTPTLDYIMGTLPGWWVGELDGRVDAPYVSQERWDQELRAAGFAGIEAAMDDANPPFQISCTMVSSVVTDRPVKPAVTLLYFQSPCAWAKTVYQELTNLGYTVKWGTLDQTPEAGEWIFSLLDIEESFLHNLSSDNYHSLHKYMVDSDRCKIIWITKQTQYDCTDPNYSLVLGLTRTLRQELTLEFLTFEVDVFNIHSARMLHGVLSKALGAIERSQRGLDYEFSLSDGCVYVGRHNWRSVRHQESSLLPQKTVKKKLDVGILGLLDTLQWAEFEDPDLGDEGIEIDTHYIGLNFRDVMVAMGLVGKKEQLGIEGSGVVRRVGSKITDIAPGDQVIVMDSGILRTRVITIRERCIILPHGISLEEGATITSVFATAIYSLIHVGQLGKGQSVLIHSACGGVGLAAIQICQLIGADIFATVGNDEKIEYLVRNYAIPRDKIFNSRSASFRSSLMKATKGRGVDIVLSSLAGKLLHASWDCVAPFGKMIELGKRDFLTNGSLSLKPFAGNRAFFGVDLLQIDIEVFNSMLSQFESWYLDGKVQPIRPITTFDAAQAADAFRYLQRGTHIGKIVIRMPHDNPSLLPGPVSQQSVRFSPDASYLLVGGLGGVGRAVSIWMVENGVRHLTYLSRSAGTSSDDQGFVRELQELGCCVECVSGSVVDMEDVRKAVGRCRMPLKGVLQMSLYLQDRSFSLMTYEEWKASLAPKVQGIWNLHHATADEKLDFFVMFGSLTGSCGRPSQANYAAANTFLDAFAQYRRQLGLPSSVLSLGPVEDVGVVSRDAKMLQTMRSVGLWMLNEADIIEGLQLAILQSYHPSSIDDSDNDPNASLFNTKISPPLLVGLGHSKPLSDTTVVTLWSERDIRFAGYMHLDANVGDDNAGPGNNSLMELLARARMDPAIIFLEETQTLITQELCQLITTYWAEAQDMDIEEKLKIQIDSLMSIEIKRWVRRNLEVDVSLPEISKAKTIGGLGDLAMERLKLKFQSDGEGKEEGEKTASEQVIAA